MKNLFTSHIVLCNQADYTMLSPGERSRQKKESLLRVTIFEKQLPIIHTA
jgi:hypothetical protein